MMVKQRFKVLVVGLIQLGCGFLLPDAVTDKTSSRDTWRPLLGRRFHDQNEKDRRAK